MQTATILLSLNGERDNQIPKYNVTPAEVLLLQAMHGDEAVTDIQIVGETSINSRDERSRLFAFYSRPNPRGGRMCQPLDALFPGVAARLPVNFADVDIDESFYASAPSSAPEPTPEPEQGKAEEEPKEPAASGQGAENLFN